MNEIKVLITGATGFIGTHLTEFLFKQNYKIYCIARDSSNTVKLKGKTEIINLPLERINELDDNLIKEFDYIYHFAGITKHYSKDFYYKINFESTKFLVDKIIKVQSDKLKRFVYCSSQAASGPAAGFYAVKETDDDNPINSYGKSKKMAEEYILSVKDKINSIIIRPPAVFGAGEKDIYSYFKLINNKLMLFVGKGNLTFSIVYVDDLIRASVKLAENNNIKSGEIFFVCNDECYTMNEFGNLIAKAMNKNPVNIYIPVVFIKLLGNINETIGLLFKKNMLLNKEKLLELSKQYWICSNEKMKKKCPDFVFTEMDKALIETYQWYKNNKWL